MQSKTPISLPADPTQPLQAATKQYVDTVVKEHYERFHFRGEYCEPKSETVDEYPTGQQCWLDDTKTILLYDNTITWSVDRQQATEVETYYNEDEVQRAAVTTVHNYDSDGIWLNSEVAVSGDAGY